MIKTYLQRLLAACSFVVSMNSSGQSIKTTKMEQEMKEGSFAFDLAFLKKHDDVIVLKKGEDAQVIVSPKFQGKVFTSTATGNTGVSFGWVNYKAFSGPSDPHMNAYGGENRVWLGPEGGRFSLFFKPGSEMTFNNWHTPAAFDTENWSVVNRSNDAVSLQKDMQLTNYSGTVLKLSINRTVTMLDGQEINRKSGVDAGASIKAVGYETTNVLTNTGATEWNETTGMPCLWLLDMFKPSPSTVIVVPFDNAASLPFDRVATTNYFGEVPADRLKHTNKVIFFKADGKSRGKIGVSPASAKPTAGSYDPQNRVLTVVTFDVEAKSKYLNQEWNTNKPTFSGDAVNAYNDGPLADGSQMGPFYELESVSPAAVLKPGAALTHKHTVYHFTGEETSLDQVAKTLLGVSLSDIKKAF